MMDWKEYDNLADRFEDQAALMRQSSRGNHTAEILLQFAAVFRKQAQDVVSGRISSRKTPTGVQK